MIKTYSLYTCDKEHELYKKFVQAKIDNNAAYFEKIGYHINEFIKNHFLSFPIIYIYGKATPYLLLHTKQPKYPISKLSALPYKTLDFEQRYLHTKIIIPANIRAILPTLSTFVLFDDVMVSGNTINLALAEINAKSNQNIIILSYLTLV